MSLIVPLPESTRKLLEYNTHPGLALDKYAKSWDERGQLSGELSEQVQKPTVTRVVHRSEKEPQGLEYHSLYARRQTVLHKVRATEFKCATVGPLTIHLSRASALENAGICLHPLYGFVYLPGSGLKGMARAFAETVWLPAQPDRKAAWRSIEDVFGWADTPDRKKQIGDPNHPAEKRFEHEDDPDSPEVVASTGCIIFHDAWPTAWPPLIVDIVNCHHRDYYGARADDTEHPPGDWENPIPVYFLAVPANVQFSFALSKRKMEAAPSSLHATPGDVVPTLPDALQLAREWLMGALCHLGAGAKTAAGYGVFRPVEQNETTQQVARTWNAAKKTKNVCETSCTLELVTPAFLAGANQKREDCDLRPATLRGILRWWWRTMHAGCVDVKTLRAMEAAVWGNTSTGSAVQIVIHPHHSIIPELFAHKDGFRPRQEFKREHNLQDPPKQKSTQGLFYASYGMDEKIKGELRQRWYAQPGTRWTVRLIARGSSYEERDRAGNILCSRPLSAESVLNQAKAALWLLCHMGGVGSKARKGFGSFKDPAELKDVNLDWCKAQAAAFRHECAVAQHATDTPKSPALETALPIMEVSTPWKDCWFALDQLGYAMQEFAKKYAHNPEKEALGLPRKIHGPKDDGPLQTKDGKVLQDRWQKPVWLGSRHPALGRRDAAGMRAPSPVHYHLARGTDGNLIIRIIAFPSRYLPDMQTSRKVLGELLKHLREDLGKRVKQYADRGQNITSADVSPQPTMRRFDAEGRLRLPRSGDLVEAVLLEEKTKRGGWRAKHLETGLSGPIHNSADVPAESKPGDRVKLVTASCNEREIAFRWPTAADEKREKPERR